ncbi:Spore coat protein I [Caloramator mitchellensis]|uniref:Spore coat protein I n=1 Tax=Caloramator mitchellensis TaxID=908809 RepID=A0A0R3JW39_CALMK|nr:CotS family spore coat protein [Caloramator mitchellensis]KRQ87792.1 Spore coat protein I [Caloramator mitchellensis]
MDELFEMIQNKYNIKVNKIEKLKNVYKIYSGDKEYCLKVSKYDFEQFDFIISAIKHLIKNGFKRVIPIIKTTEGTDFIKLKVGYGFLTQWINSRTADFKNPIELRHAVETLANMHICSRGFEHRKVKGRNLYGKWIDKFQKRLNEMLYFKSLIVSKDNRSEFDDIYLKYLDIHYKQGYDAIKKLQNSNYSEIMEEHRKYKEFCHHDSANHNFLIDENMNFHIIDFDYCVMDTHLHDLASIIIRSLRYGNWSMDILEYIIDTYSNFINIKDEEKYLICCFMSFPQDFWQVGLQYYVEKQPWGEDFFIKKLKKTTDDQKERFEFLNDFESMFKVVV